MQVKSTVLVAGLSALICGGVANLNAAQQEEPVTGVPSDTKASSGSSTSAAKNKAMDRETTQKIRKALTDDTSLSTGAHNVKIVAKDGKVTLKGMVQSEAEKQTVEQKASEVAGQGNVTSELKVKASKS